MEINNSNTKEHPDDPSTSSSSSSSSNNNPKTQLRAPPISSQELNLLILSYLQDSGFNHTAFTLNSEANLPSTKPKSPLERGLLIKYLQKGLLYDEIERSVRADGTIIPYERPLRLLKDVDVEDFSIAESSAPPPPPPPALIAPMSTDKPVNNINTPNNNNVIQQSNQENVQNAKRKHSESEDEDDNESNVSNDDKSVDKFRKLTPVNNANSNNGNVNNVNSNKYKVRSSTSAATAATFANAASTTPQPKPKLKAGEAPREQMKKLTKGEAIWLEGHLGNVYATAFNPRYSNVAASSGADGVLKIWTLPAVGREMKGKTLEVIDCPQLKGPPRKGDGRDITTIAWSADGEMIMTGAYDGSVWIWTRNGDVLMEKRVHKGPVFSVKFNKDGTRALTAGLDKRTIVWDIQTFDIEQQWQFHMGSILDADWLDNDILATAGGDRLIYVFKCGDAEPIKVLFGHTREVNQVRWDPSGEYLASGSDDATIRVWKFSKDEPYNRRPPPDQDCVGVMRGHEREIGCLIWAPLSNQLEIPLLLSGGMDGHIRLWNAENGELLWKCRHSKNHVFTADFSPDGKMLAVGGADGRITLWETTSGLIQKDWITNNGLYDLRWQAPDGNRIIFGTKNEGLAVIDVSKLQVGQ